MRLHVGTSGYSYKEWKGSFYPEDIKPDEMLAHYASCLGSVEINNTFYRLPKDSVLESWASQVPAEFRFSIKASRRITHLKRLKDADEEATYLIKTVRTLGDQLGVVLYQLPPNMKKDIDRLESFLQVIGGGPRAAFEFRHESWFDDEVLERLRAHQATLCLADTDEHPDPDLAATADWGYIRLRRDEYTPSQLADWAERLKQQSWTEVFVFFKHEDGAIGPKYASELFELF